jgi:UDP-GlcNAc:undecaprenyl-phosphate/decaprenyl-phosphate GlcNAc-1-phosphate transferase
MPAGFNGIAFVAFLVALAMAESALLTAMALFAARKLRILDYPDKHRKLHRRATPLMGGVAVVCAFTLGLWQCRWLGVDAIEADFRFERLTFMLTACAGMLSLVGLWDDKFGMNARTKLVLQTLCIVPYVLWGRSATMVNVFGFEWELSTSGGLLMLLWLVACTNFVNLIDGLDGLATSVAMIVASTVAVLAYLQGMYGVFYLAMILAGSLAGFLIFNLPPARIFLGDSGSLPLGFLVGALAVEASVKKAAGLTFAVPLVLLSIPMFDTSMAILRRKLNGRRIGQGDRQHIHHILRDRGLTPAQTLLAISLLCVAMASAAVVSTVFKNDAVAIVLCGAVLTMLVGARVFGFAEIALLTRYIRGIGLFIRSIPASLEVQFLLARLSLDAEERQLQLWKYLVQRMTCLNGISLEFTAVDLASHRELAALTWLSTSPKGDEAATWEVSLAVPRPDGVLASLVATGVMPETPQALRVNELLDLFGLFCGSGPVGDRETHPDLYDYTAHGPQVTVRKPHFLSRPDSIRFPDVAPAKVDPAGEGRKAA